MRIWSIGHGTRTLDELVAMLREAGIAQLADVRLIPASRRHPQFTREALARRLDAAGIGYRHLPGLGGRRTPRADSPHRALKVAAFRGYADHMASAEFGGDYATLVQLARAQATAFMCAESVWWRCHRRLIADRLTVDGWDVTHLLAPHKSSRHELWAVARIQDGNLVYDVGTLALGA